MLNIPTIVCLTLTIAGFIREERGDIGSGEGVSDIGNDINNPPPDL